MIPPLIALANINFAVMALQGPIVGVTFGLVIFSLGVAKSVGATKTFTASGLAVKSISFLSSDD
jgi:hypothetical protein